jgi:hypothetical protein
MKNKQLSLENIMLTKQKKKAKHEKVHTFVWLQLHKILKQVKLDHTISGTIVGWLLQGE